MSKKKLDKLSKDMIQCAKDGFGVHYGRWKATQEIVVPVVEKKLPAGWKKCEACGRPIKSGKGKKFCDEVCRLSVYHKSDKYKEYMRNYLGRKRANEC